MDSYRALTSANVFHGAHASFLYTRRYLTAVFYDSTADRSLFYWASVSDKSTINNEKREKLIVSNVKYAIFILYN